MVSPGCDFTNYPFPHNSMDLHSPRLQLPSGMVIATQVQNKLINMMDKQMYFQSNCLDWKFGSFRKPVDRPKTRGNLYPRESRCSPNRDNQSWTNSIGSANPSSPGLFQAAWKLVHGPSARSWTALSGSSIEKDSRITSRQLNFCSYVGLAQGPNCTLGWHPKKM